MHRIKIFRFIFILLLGACITTMLSTAAPSPAATPLTLVSGPSPFRAGCEGVPQTGINYLNAEVEPWVAINPTNPANIIGAWHQDRWSNGGARSLGTGVSFDGGKTWSRRFPLWTRCAGGNASNGGDYERASDPWVTFAPDGTAHQISISFALSDDPSSVLVSRSTDGGNTWSKPITLIRDANYGRANRDILNDKESITADPYDSRYVYAIWDRLDDNLQGTYKGPTLFARTDNGGQSWEQAKVIYDPGLNSQTIANQIVVLPNGDLVDVFTLILNEALEPELAGGSSNNIPPGAYIAVIRSTDKGQSWSEPYVISTLESIGVVDPTTGEPLRTGDIIPDIAVDSKTGHLSVVWQDARFSGYERDGIVFSKSTDGGFTWSKPTQINKVKEVQAFTAAVDVSTDGTIGVTYYDLRRNKPNTGTLPTNYWFLSSSDGGATWKESQIAGSFDMRTAPFARGFFVGDYEGLAHSGSTFLSMFVQANSGNTKNRTDVFFARIKPGATSNTQAIVNTAVDINRTPLSLRQRLNSHQQQSRNSKVETRK